MSPTITIAYLISFLPTTFGHAVLIETITKHRRRVSIKALIAAYSACYLLQAAVYLFMPQNVPGAIYINMASTIIPLMAITFLLYHSTIMMGLFAGAATMIGALGESIVLFAMSMFFKTPAPDLLNNPNMVATAMVLSGLVTTSILLLTSFVCRQLQKSHDGISKSYLTATLLTIACASSIVIAYSVMHTVLGGKNMSELAVFCIVTALLVMNFFVLFLYRRMVKDTEDRYRKLFGDTPAGVCVLTADESLSILLANKAFYSIMGSNPEEMERSEKKSAGGSILELLNEDAVKIVLEQMRLMQSSRETEFEYELPLHFPDGSKRIILASIHFDRQDGRLTVNVIDITDRKRMEDELRVSEERYRLALEQSGKVFFFFDIPKRSMRLPDDLAQAFGLPNVTDNMPDNPAAQSLVEKDSVDSYRDFYRRIIAGEKKGEAIISCHTRSQPEKKLWFRISFTSIFDDSGQPATAAIIYEDLTVQRLSEIKAQWKQLNLLALPEYSYMTVELDMADGLLSNQAGELFEKLPDNLRSYEALKERVLEYYVYREDESALEAFLDRDRLLQHFDQGITEDAIQCRILQKAAYHRWTDIQVQMVRDSYTGHVIAQFVIRDIHAEKSGQLETQQSMEELKRELENSRIRVMLNQMQPHFLYNALSAIQTIVKTDPDYAYKLIYDFTIHLRSSVKALQSDAPISFADELKNIRAYLNIEQMRFGDRLKVNYDIGCQDFKVIPLSIQPLAENAARHGIYPKGEAGGTLTVRSYEEAGHYVVEVIDDGEGFDVNEALDRQSDSVGLKNLIFRLKTLMNAQVYIQSQPGKGTKSTVVIPKPAE